MMSSRTVAHPLGGLMVLVIKDPDSKGLEMSSEVGLDGRQKFIVCRKSTRLLIK